MKKFNVLYVDNAQGPAQQTYTVTARDENEARDLWASNCAGDEIIDVVEVFNTYENQQRITLKKIKHSEFASQETHCFEGDVYFDGIKCATADNDGRGACTDWRKLYKSNPQADQAYTDMMDFCTKLDTVQSSFPDGVTVMMPDLGWVCDELVNQWLDVKQMKKALQKRVLWLQDGSIYQTKAVSARQRDHWIPQIQARHGAQNVLNGLPEAEAIALWRAYA